jgi:enoyl-CoA hydratase
MADYKNLKAETRGKVLLVTIDREKVLNALNRELIDELQSLFQSRWLDNSFGCVVITGAGEKAFVAGADIKELAETTPLTGAETAARGHWLMTTIQNFPKPVIAAINGFALGGGCELAMACDIRLASEKARLGQPEVGLGIIPGYGGTQRLARLVGRGKAMQLILTGDMINAAEAYRVGLVDEVYPPDQLLTKAIEMAEKIASKGPVATMMAKDCINRGLESPQTAGLDLERATFGVVCGTEDKAEGLAAFIEKRAAQFKGK